MYGLLAFVVGCLTALQSRVNGALDLKVHNGIYAGLISNSTGFVILSVIVIFIKDDRLGFLRAWKSLRSRKLAWWEYLGGIGGALFLSVQSTVVPTLGIALFTIGLVSGQASSSLLVDKIGLAPSGKKPITLLRVMTAVLTTCGVLIAVLPKVNNISLDVLAIAGSFCIGVVVAFQQAINARLNEETKRPLTTAWFNFFIGTFFLVVFLIISIISGSTATALPTNPLLYTGGIFGLLFIAASSFVIKSLGILNFILIQVAGQVTTALMLDWLAPTGNAKLDVYIVSGTAITLIAIAVPKLAQVLSPASALKE